ncbi:MAG: T9SS type A sorting domain-containing protein [Candidatus Marinimicrobia bacterium]|nr:T9SS type A sorting domain-containing protein [Candidatus Neomarinimicrobiota bacterium]
MKRTLGFSIILMLGSSLAQTFDFAISHPVGGVNVPQLSTSIVLDSQDQPVVGRMISNNLFDSITITGSFTNAYVARLSMNPSSINALTENILPQMTLQANYPNPFNLSTQISYSLNHGSQVDLRVYDVTGREVSLLTNAYQAPGNHSVSFSDQDFAAGVYIYRLTTERGVQSRKCCSLSKPEKLSVSCWGRVKQNSGFSTCAIALVDR